MYSPYVTSTLSIKCKTPFSYSFNECCSFNGNLISSSQSCCCVTSYVCTNNVNSKVFCGSRQSFLIHFSASRRVVCFPGPDSFRVPVQKKCENCGFGNVSERKFRQNVLSCDSYGDRNFGRNVFTGRNSDSYRELGRNSGGNKFRRNVLKKSSCDSYGELGRDIGDRNLRRKVFTGKNSDSSGELGRKSGGNKFRRNVFKGSSCDSYGELGRDIGDRNLRRKVFTGKNCDSSGELGRKSGGNKFRRNELSSDSYGEMGRDSGERSFRRNVFDGKSCGSYGEIGRDLGEGNLRGRKSKGRFGESNGEAGRDMGDRESRRKSLERMSCDFENVDMMLSLLIEDVGDDSYGDRKSDYKSSRRVGLEKKGSESDRFLKKEKIEKEDEGSGLLGSSSRSKYDDLRIESRGNEAISRRKEDRKSEGKERPTGEKLSRRNTGSSSSSYYTCPSPVEELQSDSEIHVRDGDYVKGSDEGYNRVPRESENVVYEGERKGNLKRIGNVVPSHKTIESDWRKKSEKKLDDEVGEASYNRGSSSHNQFDTFNDKSKSFNSEKDTRQQYSQETDYNTRVSKSTNKQKQFVDEDDVLAVFNSRMQLSERDRKPTWSGTYRHGKKHEHTKPDDHVTRRDDYRSSIQQPDQVSRIENLKRTNALPSWYEDNVIRQEDRFYVLPSPVQDTGKHYNWKSEENLRQMDSSRKFQRSAEISDDQVSRRGNYGSSTEESNQVSQIQDTTGRRTDQSRAQYGDKVRRQNDRPLMVSSSVQDTEYPYYSKTDEDLRQMDPRRKLQHSTQMSDDQDSRRSAFRSSIEQPDQVSQLQDTTGRRTDNSPAQYGDKVRRQNDRLPMVSSSIQDTKYPYYSQTKEDLRQKDPRRILQHSSQLLDDQVSPRGNYGSSTEEPHPVSQIHDTTGGRTDNSPVQYGDKVRGQNDLPPIVPSSVQDSEYSYYLQTEEDLRQMDPRRKLEHSTQISDDHVRRKDEYRSSTEQPVQVSQIHATNVRGTNISHTQYDDKVKRQENQSSKISSSVQDSERQRYLQREEDPRQMDSRRKLQGSTEISDDQVSRRDDYRLSTKQSDQVPQIQDTTVRRTKNSLAQHEDKVKREDNRPPVVSNSAQDTEYQYYLQTEEDPRQMGSRKKLQHSTQISDGRVGQGDDCSLSTNQFDQVSQTQATNERELNTSHSRYDDQVKRQGDQPLLVLSSVQAIQSQDVHSSRQANRNKESAKGSLKRSTKVLDQSSETQATNIHKNSENRTIGPETYSSTAVQPTEESRRRAEKSYNRVLRIGSINERDATLHKTSSSQTPLVLETKPTMVDESNSQAIVMTPQSQIASITGTDAPPSQHKLYEGSTVTQTSDDPLNSVSREHTLESAHRFQKSSSKIMGQFLAQVTHEASTSHPQVEKSTTKEEMLHKSHKPEQKISSEYDDIDLKLKDQESRRSSGSSVVKEPSDEIWDEVAPSTRESLDIQTQAPERTIPGESIVVKRSGRFLWNVFSDIVKLRWSSQPKTSTPKSDVKNSPNQSTSSDTWFSGHDRDETSDENIKRGNKSMSSVSMPTSTQSQGEGYSSLGSKDKISPGKTHIGSTTPKGSSTVSPEENTKLDGSTMIETSVSMPSLRRSPNIDDEAESDKRTTISASGSLSGKESRGEGYSSSSSKDKISPGKTPIGSTTPKYSSTVSLEQDIKIGGSTTIGTSVSMPSLRRSPNVDDVAESDKRTTISASRSLSGKEQITVSSPVNIKGSDGRVGGDMKRKMLQRTIQTNKDRFDEWEEASTLETEQKKIDEAFMREALIEARKAGDLWEVPVGAVLVQHGKIVARGYNLVEELRDSTAHAEMICIREASNQLRTWRLADSTLYVTLEPCPMCAGAILQARIDTVVWGAPNKLLGADGSWIRLFPAGSEGVASSESTDKPPPPVHPFHPRIVMRRNVLGTECANVMQQFFQLRRRKKDKKLLQDAPPTPPSCLPISNHLKILSKMHGLFHSTFSL